MSRENPVLRLLGDEFSSFIIKLDDYTRVKLIGKGGYAEVWLATKNSTGEKVALKQLYSSITPKQARSFAREIRTMATGDHPFFLRFVGFSASDPFTLASEYMVNGALFRFLRNEKRSQRLTGTHRTLIAMGVAHAMGYLHGLGIIHRDLKSMNILLDGNCLPRICDFGIARFLDPNEVMTTQIGTPHWMAPEILEGKNYGYAVDVYSFAMLLYEMATDSIPWAGVEPAAVIKLVCTDRARPVIPKSTPEPLKKLIQLCWSHSPNRRPTFAGIYHLFKTHQVAFEGTDERMVAHLERKLKRFILSRKNGPVAQSISTDKLTIKEFESKQVAGEKAEVVAHVVYDDETEEATRDSPLAQDVNSLEEDDHDIESQLVYHGEQPHYSVMREGRRKPGDRSEIRTVQDTGRNSNLIDMSVIGDVNNYGFKLELKKASQLLQKGQSIEFFNVIGVYFSDKTDVRTYRTILMNMKQILRHKWAMGTFIDCGLHSKLPIMNDQLFEVSTDILLLLFRESPEVFQDYQTQMNHIITKSPRRAIILLATFCNAFDDLDNAWTLVDLMIRKSHFFLKSEAAQEFIATLFCLCSNHEKYREARLQHCLDVFIQGTVMSDPRVVSACYNSLAAFWNHSIKVDIDTLIGHLKNEETAEAAVQIPLRMKHIPRRADLVEALLECAQYYVEACFCLVRIAVKEEGAVLILKNPSWISRGMPTFAYTLRLFLTVFYHNTFRQALLGLHQTATLVISLCSERESSYFANISSIIRCVDLTPELVMGFSKRKVFEAVFRAALAKGDEVCGKSILEIVGVCAQVAHAPDYRMVIESIPTIIEAHPKLELTVMPVLTILSMYDDYVDMIKDLKLDRMFVEKFSGDANYEKYASTFLENMK